MLKDSPLYKTGTAESGKPLYGGIFTMQDSFGYPIEMSLIESKERGFEIDWLEALADCWLNDCLKFKSFAREVNELTKQDLTSKFKDYGALLISQNPEFKNAKNPVDEACKLILKQKKSHLKSE